MLTHVVGYTGIGKGTRGWHNQLVQLQGVAVNIQKTMSDTAKLTLMPYDPQQQSSQALMMVM